MDRHRILIVEDSQDTLEIAKAVLSVDFDVSVAADLASARSRMASATFDLILLDVNLPDGDGFSFCQSLKETCGEKMPLLFFLTGNTEQSDRLHGFNLGADDYIVKPFHPMELRARVQARLRRVAPVNEATELKKGDIRFDLSSQRAYLIQDGTEVALALTPAEFKILYHLARHEPKSYSRAQIIDAVWGNDIHISERTVDTHVSKLRTKLRSSQFTITPVRSVGYAFGAKD